MLLAEQMLKILNCFIRLLKKYLFNPYIDNMNVYFALDKLFLFKA